MERARVARHPTQHLVGDMLSERRHTPLDIVHPRVDLSFLAWSGPLRKLRTVTRQVPRNWQLVAYKCAIRCVFKHGVAAGHGGFRAGLDDDEVLRAHELGDEADEGGGGLGGIRGVMEFL